MNHADQKIRDDINALLAAKKGIDESKAKRLRKQWDERQRADEVDESLAALFTELRERIHAQVEVRAEKMRVVDAELAQLKQHLDDGDVKAARQCEQKIINQLNNVPGLATSRRQTIITELETYRPKLRELTSWRKWGTVQAREKMIEEMKGLHKSSKKIPDIKKRVEQARKEWQQWDATGEGGDSKLYEVFNAACKRVERRCYSYFMWQEKQRRTICETLETTFTDTDWRAADWKAIQKQLREQIREWRRTGARAEKKESDDGVTVSERFDAIVEKFNDRIDRERQRNRRAREKLIADVEKLAEVEDSRAAMTQLQALKSQWTPTVTLSRGDENKIWKQFTDACDKIYANRDQARKEFKKELSQNLDARKKLCAEIETAIKENNTDVVKDNIAKWKTQWNEIGAAPKLDAAKLNKRFEKLMSDARAVIEKAEADNTRRTQDLLREKSLLCAAVEAAVVAEDADSVKSLTAKWDSLSALPDELETAIAKRYQLAQTAATDANQLKKLTAAMPKNLEALNALLLQLEIACELDSPPEFSKQRMALQIERLSAAMGKGAAANKSLEELVTEILLVGAVEAAAHKVAFERLGKCLAAAS